MPPKEGIKISCFFFFFVHLVSKIIAFAVFYFLFLQKIIASCSLCQKASEMEFSSEIALPRPALNSSIFRGRPKIIN